MKATLRLIAVLVVCISLLTLFPAVPSRAESRSKLTWKNLIYTLENNQITITGVAEGTTGAVTIPNYINGSLVVAIQNYAFQHAEGITSVNTGSSVTSIGEFAFEYCSNLTEVTIGKAVSKIAPSAFKDCPKLEKIRIAKANTYFSSSDSGILYNKTQTELIKAPAAIKNRCIIPDTVVTIQDSAFEFCNQLSGVHIGSGVTSIGYGAFRGCTSMNDLSIGENVKTIGQEAFSNCTSLTSIQIPSSVTSMGKEAFNYCNNVTDLTIGDGLTVIPEGAFMNLHSLVNLTWGKNVRVINKDAFRRCESLETITIPDSVLHVYKEAFSYCYKLSQVTFGTGLRTLTAKIFYCTNVEQLTFSGPAPSFHDESLMGVYGVARYPYADESWTANVLQNYGGEITWEAYSQTAVLQGTVTSAGSGDATLSLWIPGAAAASYTANASGKYSIENILPGEYLLRASKKNHVSREYTIPCNAGEITFQSITLRLLGDVKVDDLVNITDVALLYAHIRQTKTITYDYTRMCGDCNGDGKVNIIDVSLLYAHIKQTISIHN